MAVIFDIDSHFGACYIQFKGGEPVESFERVKYLRKQILHETQEKFAESIDISRSNLGGIETGKVNLVERVAKAICRAYKVNYGWLMEGIGDPIIETPDDLFDEVKREYDLSEDDIALIKEICELEDDERNELKKYIRSLIKAKKEEAI